MIDVRTVLIAQVVLIYMQAIGTIRQKHVWYNAGAYEAIAIIGIELTSSGHHFLCEIVSTYPVPQW